MEVAYDLRCQSDPLRLTRHNKLYGATLCPVSEKTLSLIMSDSRVLVWELTAFQVLFFILIESILLLLLYSFNE